MSVGKVAWTYKGDVNSASGENWKEPSSSTISTEASCNGDNNEQTPNVKQNLLAILENKWDIKYIQTLPAPREGASENIGEGLHQKGNLRSIKHHTP